MKARHHQLYQEQVYRAYVSEAIKNLTKAIADMSSKFGIDGAIYMSKSYTDIVYPPKESNRTAEDIINNIKQKIEEYE